MRAIRLWGSWILLTSFTGIAIAQSPPLAPSTPEIFCPGIEVKGPTEPYHIARERIDGVPWLDLKRLLNPFLTAEVATDASPEARLRAAQSVLAAQWLWTSGQLSLTCNWRERPTLDATDVCKMLARAAADPVAGHEAAVLYLREQERLTTARARAGQDPPQAVPLARLLRMNAEAGLLRARESQRASRATGAIRGEKPDLAYTAFPELVLPLQDGPRNGRVPDFTSVLRPLAQVSRVFEEGEPTAKERLSAQTIGAASNFLGKTYELILVGKWDSDLAPMQFVSVCELAMDAAEDREGFPAERVAVAEAVVRALKELERFTAARTNAGMEPPQRLHRAKLHRMEAELRLLKLREHLGNVASLAVEPTTPLRRLRGLPFTAYPDMGFKLVLPGPARREDAPRDSFFDPKWRDLVPAYTVLQPTLTPQDWIHAMMMAEARNYLKQTEQLIAASKWDSRMMTECIEVCRVALDAGTASPSAAARVECRRAGVIFMKCQEQLTQARVTAGQDAPQAEPLVVAFRMAAERRLIEAEAEAAKPQAAPAGCACGRSSGKGSAEPVRGN